MSKAAFTFEELIDAMVEAITERGCVQDGDGKPGIMHFVFEPLSESAREYLGVCEHSLESSQVILMITNKGNVPPKGDWRWACVPNYKSSAFSKISACRFAVEQKIGCRSDDCPQEAIGASRINTPGCVAFDIKMSLGTHDAVAELDWLRVYVSVSSGHIPNDEYCAMGAEQILREFARSRYQAKDHQYTLSFPNRKTQ